MIGQISVSFATLDFLVSYLLSRLLPRSTSGEPPYRKRSTLGQKLAKIAELEPHEVADPDLLAKAQELVPDAQETAEERNRYIHDQWVFEPGLVSRGRIKRIKFAFGHGNRTEEILSIQAMIALSERVGRLQVMFGGLTSEDKSEPPK